MSTSGVAAESTNPTPQRRRAVYGAVVAMVILTLVWAGFSVSAAGEVVADDDLRPLLLFLVSLVVLLGVGYAIGSWRALPLALIPFVVMLIATFVSAPVYGDESDEFVGLAHMAGLALVCRGRPLRPGHSGGVLIRASREGGRRKRAAASNEPQAEARSSNGGNHSVS